MKRKAFTLVESIMVMVLVSIVAFVFSFYIREAFDAWTFLSTQKKLAMSTRSAMYRMVREIKRLKSTSGITIFNPDEFAFVDVDGSTVNFRQIGSDLIRNNDVLLENLQDPGGLNFTYLDASGSQVADRDLINIVKIRLTTARANSKFVLESTAAIRNTE